MKKIISFALAIMLVATMSVTAFAAEEGVGTGDYNVPVSGTYQTGGTAGEKISVDISWGSMEFTYTAASQGEWNPGTHNYGEGASAKWTATGNTITIKNHSNVDVNAKFSFTAAEELNLTYEFKKGDTEVTDAGVNIDSADDSQYQTAGEDGKYPAPTAEVTFSITGGSIDKDYKTTDGAGLGNITVTIAKASN